MMSNALKGVHRYETFGLHASWLEAFLTEPARPPKSIGYLGPRQRLALERYLEDADIWNSRIGLTGTGKLLSESIGNPNWGEYAWPCVWTRLCTAAPVFQWYSKCSRRVWTLEELSQAMQSAWPGIASRTLYNARLELLGTLGNTPLGRHLGQGTRLMLNGVPALERKGPPRLTAYWALFCASVLSQRGPCANGGGEPGEDEISAILGVSDSVLAAAFGSLWRPDLFEVSKEGAGSVRITLAPDLTPERVLKTWIAQA